MKLLGEKEENHGWTLMHADAGGMGAS